MSVTSTDVNVVNVSGTHTYINDLVFNLVRNGNSRRLYGPSCNHRNNFSFGFDDESSGTPPCAPTDGNNYPPVASLDVFDGQDAAGNWTLRIRDRYNQDGGQLNSWSLEVCSIPVAVENPDMRLGKSASVAGREVSFILLAVNSGDVDLSTVQINDDLDASFGAGNYSLLQTPQLLSAPNGFSINANYTGHAGQTNLLSNGGVLPAQSEIRIRVVVRVDSLNFSSTGIFSNQAVAAALSDAGTVLNDLSGNGLDLSVDQDIPTPVTISAEVLLSGSVFRDTSAIAALAHDGVIQAGEQGVGSRGISVFNVATGQIVSTALSDGGGVWRFSLDSSLVGQELRIVVDASSSSEFVSESPGLTTGPVTDGEIRLTPLFDSPITEINFGVVYSPHLQVDQTLAATPNSAVRYAHTYRSPTHGSVVFSVDSEVQPANLNWRVRLLQDLNCNGVLEPAELLIDGSIATAFDEIVCLVIDTFVPANAVAGSRQELRLQSHFIVDDLAATNHGVTFMTYNTDLTSVTSLAGGKLVLEKTVRNRSTGGAAVHLNSGLPGHVLEYTIHYVNQGDGPIADLVINDQAPAFTQVQAASVQCGVMPAMVSCVPAVAGDELQWDILGSLAAGASGSVSYRVEIQ